MRYGVEIDDSLLSEIKAFCKLNSLKLNKYLSGIIAERFYVDKYGDLNEKFAEKDSPIAKHKNVKNTKKQEGAVEEEKPAEKRSEDVSLNDANINKKTNENKERPLVRTRVLKTK